MRQILHILTTEDDSLAREIVSVQRRLPDHEVQVVDLTKPEPDYKALLQKIFASDSTQVW